MTKTEVVGVMAILETAYPTYYAKRSNQQRMEAVNLWAELFREDDPELVAAAVKTIIVGSQNPFPPAIGEIKLKMRELVKKEEELSETQAWALVSKACANGIYGYQKEFEKLPPAVQAAIGRPEQLREWAMMDAETVNSVVASNFMRGYKAAVSRATERDMLPESVRVLISNVGVRQLGDGRNE